MSANASLLGLIWVNNGNKNEILAGHVYSDISWRNVDCENKNPVKTIYCVILLCKYF